MIDQRTVEQIYDAVDIADVVQDFVTLKKRGANYLGLCPFHNEKTPSFTVSASKGIYKCFGCGEGGNAVNFIMKHENLTYYEALKFLAAKYNIEIVEKERTEEDIQQQNDRESMLVITSFAQRYFSNTLFHDEEGIAIGLSYLKERGFRMSIIEKFGLGYCPGKKDSFTNQALKEGYKKEYLVKAGLTIDKDGYVFDRFRGRVIFPVYSLSGKVIAFGGRTLQQDKKTAKYLNSPESEIYHKSNVLYGIYQARKAINMAGKCYLVEGYTDVISLHQNGVENVVASSGTSLTREQIRLIKRFTENVTIIYDGDEAGIKASLRGIDLILEENLNVKIVLLPVNEDPDSFARKHSNEEMNEYIAQNEKDFILFKTELLLKDTKNDPVKKASLIQGIVSSIAIIPDGIKRSVYIKECSGLLEVEENVLYTEINKKRKHRSDQNYKKVQRANNFQDSRKDENETGIISGETSMHERELIRLMINYGDKDLFEMTLENEKEPESIKMVKVAEFIIGELQKDEKALQFQDPLYKKILEEYSAFLERDEYPDQKYFTHHADNDINRIAVDLLSVPYPLSKIWEKNENYIETEEMKLAELVPESIIAFKNKKIMIELDRASRELKKAQEEGSLEKMLELQQKFMVLNDIKKTFAKDLGDRIILS